jgi:hypothetical protein
MPESMRKERNMNKQKKLVSQLIQEANEDFATIDEDLLDAVTGAGNCASCSSGKNASQSKEIDAIDPDHAIKNDQGHVANLGEVVSIWEKENPSVSETGRDQKVQWSPRKGALPDGQIGYVRSFSGRFLV